MVKDNMSDIKTFQLTNNTYPRQVITFPILSNRFYD